MISDLIVQTTFALPNTLRESSHHDKRDNFATHFVELAMAILKQSVHRDQVAVLNGKLELLH
jgi:hypothetical protein